LKVKVARSDIYIPRWRGNKDLPEDEQIRVEYSYMTAEQEEKYSDLQPKYVSEDDKMHYEIEVKYNINAIWEECVKKVMGLVDEESGKEISDPKKVKNIPGIYGLITEVVGHIKKGIDEEEVKNL
jgi:hypothetical protein